MTFLRNTWYPAAWDEEIPAGGMLARTFLGEPVVLFRKENGAACALFDRCPHRFAPLHMGRLCGDGVIQCGYHGLEFDQTGACVRNPHGDGRIPAGARVKAYPVEERHSLVWIWMGEPERADPAAVPDFAFLDRDRNEVGQGYLHARANYLLEVDNIMDLSHVEFMHASTLGSPGIAAADPVVSREGADIWTKRWITDHTLSDFMYRINEIAPGTLVDRWTEVRWTAPANMALHVGVVPMGRPREEASANWQCHLFTPETETTTHYWYGIGFPKSMGPKAAELARLRINGVRKPFETEDLPMLEAQQAWIGTADFWSLKPVLLSGDAAGVQARRMLAKMIEREGADGSLAKVGAADAPQDH